jgi:WD40 repeat protein
MQVAILDEKIGEIGKQTMSVERNIRSFKSEINMLKPSQETFEPNSCIKTCFGHTDSVECIDFESTFGKLVSGSADKSIRVWDLTTYNCDAVLEGHMGWVRAIQISGYNVISGSGDHTAKLWDISKVEDLGNNNLDRYDDDDPLCRTFYGHSGGITCLQFKDRTLITGSVDKTIRQWDIETGAGISILRAELDADNLDVNVDVALYGADLIKDSDQPQVLSEPVFHAWDTEASEKKHTNVFNVGGHVGGLHFWKHALAAG